MASGKSVIGKCLSDAMQMPFVDLDTFIEEKEQKTISTIFKEDGEVYFRLKEHQYLKELITKKESFILSLGGGTPCYAGNMDVINADNNAISIYLKATLKTLVNRLQKQKETRPLVANLSGNHLTEFVAKHLFERSFFYEQAKQKIKTDNKSLANITKEIVLLLTVKLKEVRKL